MEPEPVESATSAPDQAAPDAGSPVVVAPPADSERPRPVFYRVDYTRVTLSEFLRATRSLTGPIAWVLVKVFRVRIEPSTDDPAVERLADFAVPIETLPETYRQLFDPMTREFEAAGFRACLCHDIDDHLQLSGTVLVTFLHPSRPIVARIHCRVWTLHTPPKIRLFVECITARADGSFVWSLSSRFDLKSPPNCRVIRRLNARAAVLLDLHEQALAQFGPHSRTLPAANAVQVGAIIDSLHASVRDFHLKRRVFVALTHTELAARDARRDARRKAVDRGSKYPDVLTELDRLQRSSSSVAGAISLLLVSLAFFLVIGVQGQGSFLRLLAFVPILFFHEAGHFVAMRLSGYRNLRMFFIPGFGAAVTGQAFNVPGWKKVFVSLMGPAPGIVVGIITGLCGMVWQSPWALEAALLIVILNGFNLLPILPLDGGHVVQTVLFSRNYVLDAVFRVVAAAGLVAMAAAMNVTALFYVAGAVLLSLPSAVKTARAARDLRAAGLRPISADDQTIPPDIAEKIVERLRSGATTPTHAKLVAQQALQVFETMSTRPPGVLASIGLLSLHALFLGAAAAFCVQFVVARGGPLGTGGLPRSPRHALTDVPALRTAAATNASGPYVTLVATFSRHGRAAMAYEHLSQAVPVGGRATLYGDTVYLRLPAADAESRKRWLAELKPGASDAFVDGAGVKARFRVEAVAPDERTARALHDQLSDYLQLPLSQPLIAPWSKPSTLTAAQQLARRTYLRLESVSGDDLPEAKDMRRKISEARRAGDQAEARALIAKYPGVLRDLRRKQIARLADDASGEIDTDLVKRYLDLPPSGTPAGIGEKAQRELAPSLGLVSPGSPGDGASAGYVTRAGKRLRIEALSFDDPALGVEALAAWLRSMGCSTLRYDTSGQPDYDDPDEDPGTPP